MIFMSISSVFPCFSIPIYLIDLHFSCCLPWFCQQNLQKSCSFSDPSCPAPTAQQIGTVGTSPPSCPQHLDPDRTTAVSPPGIGTLDPGDPQKYQGIPGGIPGAGDAQNQGTSCFIGNAWEIIELY